MITVARITTLGNGGQLVAWVEGRESYKRVINPESTKAGKDEIVLYAADMPYVLVCDPRNLLHVDERRASIIMVNGHPEHLTFNLNEAKEIATRLLQSTPDVQIIGLSLPA